MQAKVHENGIIQYGRFRMTTPSSEMRPPFSEQGAREILTELMAAAGSLVHEGKAEA